MVTKEEHVGKDKLGGLVIYTLTYINTGLSQRLSG